MASGEENSQVDGSTRLATAGLSEPPQNSQRVNQLRLSDGSSLPPSPARNRNLNVNVQERPEQNKDTTRETMSPMTSLEQYANIIAMAHDTIPGVVDRQRELQQQLNNFRTQCDNRLVEEAQKTAKYEVDGVKRLVKSQSLMLTELSGAVKDIRKTEAEGRVNIQTRFDRLCTEMETLADTIADEKQARIESVKSWGTENNKLFTTLTKLTNQLEQVERDFRQDKKERVEVKRQQDATKKALEETKKMHEATAMELQEMKKTHAKVMKRREASEADRSHQSYMSSGPQAPSAVSDRTGITGALARRSSGQQPSVAESRKRPPPSPVTPSRESTAKRPKIPVSKPSAADNDSDDLPLSQTTRGKASQPSTPRRTVAQPTAKSTVASSNRSNRGSSVANSPANNPTSTIKKQVKKGLERPIRERTPEGLTKVSKDKFRYIRELKAFRCYDFPRYKALREDYIEATHQFSLFRLEIKNDMCEFFLQTGGKDMIEPCPRDRVDNIPKESKQTDTDRDTVQDLGIVEACKFTPRGRLQQRGAYYLLCLGEIYKLVQSSKASKKESTGWFVFIDVASKDKPVYMIWRQDTYRDGRLVSTSARNAATMGLEAGDRRDFFILLPSISQWPKDPERMVLSDDQIKKVIESHGQETNMLFTKPLYNYLVDRINDGWDRVVASRENVCPAGAATGAATRLTTNAATRAGPALAKK